MHEKNKKKLLFDATILTNGLTPTSGRSGIYFTAYNLLKEFIESNEFTISLYSSIRSYSDLRTFLQQEFPYTTFSIITSKSVSYKKIIYNKLKKIKAYAKSHNEIVSKFLIHILLNILSVFLFFEEQIHKIKLIKYKKYDIFFSPVFAVPKLFAKIKTMRKYVVLYDTIPLLFSEYYVGIDGWFSKLMKSLNNSDNYFAISNSARLDFLRFSANGIQQDKIKTTLLACDKKFNQKAHIDIKNVKDKYHIPLDKKYIFSLCTLEPRKNLVRTIKTFITFLQKNNIDDMVFVLGGGHWEKFISLLEDEIENLGENKDKILKIGYVDDVDLAPLYSGAEWFVYTSQYEGFGLPPLEAMSCGCPVVTSNNSSLPEVVGDAGIMIDWDSDEQHIKAYEKYYYDKDYRNKMVQQGLERSKLFSWEKSARQMIEAMSNDQ